MNLMEENAQLRKIDSSGKYCHFPGVTVVSAVGEENQDLWSAIFQGVKNSPLLSGYYGLLPLESYHMTTINLDVEAKTPQWLEYIDAKLPWFRSLHQEVELNSFNPSVLSIEPLFLGSILLLRLQLPPEQIEANERIVSKFSIRDRLPQYYHITLGYQYRSFDEVTSLSLQREFTSITSECLKSYRKPVILDAPHLTYFNNMTAFIPWDATENPFRALV